MTKKITQAEMDRRREIIAQTDANNRLEGISPCEKGSLGKQLEEQWVNGEITAKEAREIVKKHYGLE